MLREFSQSEHNHVTITRIKIQTSLVLWKLCSCPFQVSPFKRQLPLLTLTLQISLCPFWIQNGFFSCLASFDNNLHVWFVHVVVCSSCWYILLFFFLQYPSECVYHDLCMFSVANGYLSCFQFWAKINNATVNMHFSAHKFASLLGVYQEEGFLSLGSCVHKFQFSFRI